LNVGLTECLLFSSDAEWERAQGELTEAGFGDGLPLVVPTAKRMDGMLAGVANPTEPLGEMPPLMGALTIEAVAYCCVLAGCTPAELPVVTSGALAALEPEFNLLGIQTTTGTPTVCLVVHGPIVHQLHMNFEVNCLGSGNRANACIGRALQLVFRNVGGTIPGMTDMATMGQPGKYIFCFAEGPSNLISSLAVRRGLDAAASAVTIIGVSGTLEVLPHHPADSPESILMPMVDAMHGGRLAHDAAENRAGGEQFMLLPPEMGDLIGANGWTLPKMQEFMWDKSPGGTAEQAWPLARSPGDINVIATGGVGTKSTCLIPWGAASLSMTRALLPLRSS